MYDKILEDNPTKSERTDFSTPFTTNTAKNTANTLYKAQEENTDVYYFAGQDTESTPINNWVKFGTENIYIYNDQKVRRAEDAEYPVNEEECLSSKICEVTDEDKTYYIVGSNTEENCSDSYLGVIKDEYAEMKSLEIYWRIIRTNED